MKKKWYSWLCAVMLFGTTQAIAAVNPDDLLPPEQAFIPTVEVNAQGVKTTFQVADGYYMYQSKIEAVTDPAALLSAPTMSAGEEKEDEFFGKQTVYHKTAQFNWKYAKPINQPYKITLHYQGCAEAGVCYPPVETSFDIQGEGVYNTQVANNNPANTFLKKPSGAPNPTSQPTTVAPNSSAPADAGKLTLSRDTLLTNLFWFFCGWFRFKFHGVYVSTFANCVIYYCGR